MNFIKETTFLLLIINTEINEKAGLHRKPIRFSGVLIWEIFCFGLTPYSSMGLDDVVTFVASGGRLEQTLSIPSNVRI